MPSNAHQSMSGTYGSSYRKLVSPSHAANVAHVLVGGRLVKRDGELVGVDLDRAYDLAEQASERILGAVLADGQPLLPAPFEGFDDMISSQARANLARAWAIEAPS